MKSKNSIVVGQTSTTPVIVERDNCKYNRKTNGREQTNNEENSWYDKAREKFSAADDLSKAMEIVWGKNRNWHDFYQHYTTLSSAVTKIATGRWWLSRSDSDKLNDKQESLKFGRRTDYARTYQASFVHGAAESAALWGIYVRGNPFAVRITIGGSAMEKWVEGLNGETIHSAKSEYKIANVDFRDIIYAAVGFPDKQKTRLDISRNNSLYWSEVNSKSNIPHLEDGVKVERCSAWMKDYEWRHERESRLCVRVGRVNSSTAMWVPTNDNLLLSMKFTFSPWLDQSREAEVESILKDSVTARFGEEKTKEWLSGKPFRRSVLQGALNLKS